MAQVFKTRTAPRKIKRCREGSGWNLLAKEVRRSKDKHGREIKCKEEDV
jgi:hypothetical protein